MRTRNEIEQEIQDVTATMDMIDRKIHRQGMYAKRDSITMTRLNRLISNLATELVALYNELDELTEFDVRSGS